MRPWFAVAFVAALAGQAPAPPPADSNTTAEIGIHDEPPLFQSRVNLVRVPVVVRDRAGKPVGGLRQEDFQLYDKGKLQRVAQFAIEGSAAPKPPAVAAPDEASAPEEPAEPSKPGQPPAALPTRFIAYVFDDLHLDTGDLMQARQAATRHMQQALRPTDRAAIFALSGHVSIEFTDDRALLEATLQKITPAARASFNPPFSYYFAEQIEKTSGEQGGLGSSLSPGDPVWALALNMTADCLNLGSVTQPGPAAAAPGIAQATARQVVNQGQQEIRNTLLMLKSLASRLASMPGDRSIILVSSGFFLADELRPEMARAIDSAIRSNVIVNTLDARGLYAPPPAPDLPGCQSLDPNTAQQILQFDRQEDTAKGLMLDELAEGTGGVAFRNNNDLLAGFNSLSAPPEYIYYLGFYPQNLKPDGSYHALKVTLANGKGLSVKARRGYWAPAHPEDQATQASREIQEAVFSRDEVRDLPVYLRTQFFKPTEEDARLKVVAHLDLKALRFRKDEGRNRDDVTIVCALFDRNGNFLKGTQKVIQMRLKDENMSKRLASGIDVGTDFDVKIGAYLIRVVVRDAGGQQLAATNGSVEIP